MRSITPEMLILLRILTTRPVAIIARSVRGVAIATTEIACRAI